MRQIVVPPSEGRAVRVAKGQRIVIATPEGRQAADFFAFNAVNIGEWSPPSCEPIWASERNRASRRDGRTAKIKLNDNKRNIAATPTSKTDVR